MPCTYATETYKEVLTWLDNTPIAYAANPKRIGSKSHVRYAKYATAKTVGEALRKGSYYLDLLFDHEHGYLKATGGPKRKGLVNPNKNDWDATWTKTDKILSTMHQKWITWTNTFAVADRLGVDRRNLTNNKMGGISVEMHAYRMEAQAMAQLILDEADKRSMPITDSDMQHVLNLWAWKQNSNRQNVMPEGVEWVKSDTLGLLSSYDGTVLVNNATKHYPAVPKLMCRWLKDHMPKEMQKDGFAFTSINVNRGYAAKLHRDGNNEGPSFIAAFGDFTGGQLMYWGDDDKTLGTVEKCCKPEDATTVDIKKNLLLFDGNRGHAVTDFEGDRFTLVFFSIGRSFKASAESKQTLIDAGFPFPDAQALKRNQSQLSPPIGYTADYHKKVQRLSAYTKRNTSRAFARSDGKNKAVVDLLTPEQVTAAKEAAKFVEPPQDDDDTPADTEFIGHMQDRKFTPDGLRTFRLFLKGASGRLVLAVEGLERKQGTGHYDYRKVEGFNHGPPLDTTRLGEVRDWIEQVVTKPAKSPKKRQSDGNAADVETPPKKQKAAAPTPPKADTPKADKTVAGKPLNVVNQVHTKAQAAASAKLPGSVAAAMEQLVRCTEETAIQYKAGGKTEQSHASSYQRYEKYSKAKTLPQALELGSSASDMLYDCKAGLLKITGKQHAPGTCPPDSRLGRIVQNWQKQLLAGRV